MDRINGAGHVNHLFVAEDVPTNRPPTEITEAWLNSVQEEIAKFPEALGVVLDPANNHQMYDAVVSMIALALSGTVNYWPVLDQITQAAGLTVDHNNPTQVIEAIQRLIDAQSGNYALDTGIADAYLVALNPAIAAYGDGMTVRVKIAHTNTGASTLDAGAGPVPLVNDVGGAMLPGDLPAGGVIAATFITADNKFFINSLVLSQSMSQAQADARYLQLSNYKKVSVRQTVSQAPVDTAGLPTFLPSTSASLLLTTQNVSAGINALVVTAASGSDSSGDVNRVGASTSNSLSWTCGTGSGVNYLPVLVNADGTLTAQTPRTLAPIYQLGGTPSVTSGQYTFYVATMTMYLGDGAAANVVYHVIVGQITAGASTLSAGIAYALNGYYDSGYTATLAGTGTLVSKNSNIGLAIVRADQVIECTSTDLGYAVGDIMINPSGYCGTDVTPIIPIVTNNVVSITTGQVNAYEVMTKSTGALGVLTAAKWKYKFIVRRTF